MRRGACLRLLLAAGAASALWTLYLKLQFVGFMHDPVWYLEPARNFALGKGLVTRLLYPAQLAFLPPGARLPVPPLHHGPWALALIGWGFRLFGVADWVPMACSFALILATGLLMHRLGCEAGGERVGLLACALYWSDTLLIDAGSYALTDPLFTLLITAGAMALWRSAISPRPLVLSAAAGLALGLASGTRLAGQTYWLGFALAALWLHRGARRPLAALAAGTAAGLVPLAAYNRAAAGIWFYSPGIYVLLWSRSFPGFRSSTTYMSLSTLQAVLAYPLDILQKMATGPFYAVNRFLEAGQAPYAAACVFFGSLVPHPERAASRWRAFALILSAPVVLANIVISYGAVHYLLPLLPLLLVVGSLFVWRLVDEAWPALRGPWRAGAASAGAAFLFLSPAALQIKELWKTRRAREESYARLQALGGFVRERTRAEEVLYTDDPPNVLWQADRPAVALTATLADAEKAFAHLRPDALVLTSLRTASEDYDPAWRRAFEARAPVMGFKPCDELSLPGLRALLYRRPGECARRQT